MYNSGANDHRNRPKKPEEWYGNSFQPQYHAFRQQAPSFHQAFPQYGPSHTRPMNYSYSEYRPNSGGDYWSKQYVPPSGPNIPPYGFHNNRGYNGSRYDNYVANQGNITWNEYGGVQSYNTNRQDYNDRPSRNEKRFPPNDQYSNKYNRFSNKGNGDHERQVAINAYYKEKHLKNVQYRIDRQKINRDKNQDNSVYNKNIEQPNEGQTNEKAIDRSSYYNSHFIRNSNQNHDATQIKQELDVNVNQNQAKQEVELDNQKQEVHDENDDDDNDDDYEDISDEYESELDELDKELEDWNEFIVSLESDNDDSESKRRCSNTYYNSGVKEETKQEIREVRKESPRDGKITPTNHQHLTISAAVRALSDDFLLKYLKKIFDYITDEHSSILTFAEVTDPVQINFLFNIKSSKRILFNLKAECAEIYRKIMRIHSQCKISWCIRWRRINGMKVPEYKIKPPKRSDQKALLQEIKREQKPKITKTGSAVTRDFVLKTLQRTLSFLEDDQQASLVFNDVSHKDQLRFVLRLRRMNMENNFDSECWNIYKKILQVVRFKKGEWKWTVSCKNFKFGKILEYQKKPHDTNSVNSDRSEGRRTRVRKRSRIRIRNKEPKDSDDRSKKDTGMISFLPQSEKDAEPTETASETPEAPAPRVNKEKAMILEGLAKPVVASKAERMMMMMGWKGGALGSKGDGIVEPLAPNLLQVSGAGLGHVREEKSRPAPGKRLPARQLKRADDFEVGVWEPIVPSKLNKNKKLIGSPRKMHKRAVREALKTTALKRLQKFVADDREMKLTFDSSLTAGHRKIIHVIVAALCDGSDPELDNNEQVNLFHRIEETMDCVLYTESSGEKKERTRQIWIYKTVSPDTYLITPEDLEDVVEPAEFIGDEKDDCFIVETDNNVIDITNESGHMGMDSSCTENDSGHTGNKSSHMGMDSISVPNDSGHSGNDSGHTGNESGHMGMNSSGMGDVSGQTGNDSGHTGNDSGHTGIADEKINTNDLNSGSADEVQSKVTFNAYNPVNNNKFSIIVEDGGKITGISIFGERIVLNAFPNCPENAKCKMFQLCRSFLPNDDSSSNSSVRNWKSDSSSNESVEFVSATRHRKRPYSKINTKEVALIESKMKSIALPKREESLTKQEKITKLLVTYMVEFFDDAQSTKLRFLGDFKVVDRIIINSFMSELLRCTQDNNMERLRIVFSKDEESFRCLKRILFEESIKISVERRDDGPFSTYTAMKIYSTSHQ